MDTKTEIKSNDGSAQAHAEQVGKIFRQKNTEGRRAEYRYKILEFIPAADFGRRGKLPAFRVHRLSPVGIHTPPCVEFLRDFELAPEES